MNDEIEPPFSGPPSEGTDGPSDVATDLGIDLSLLAENLKLTPWERLLANDDALEFIDAARAALKAHHAAP